MIVDLGTRAVSVLDDEPSAAFTALTTHEVSLTPIDVASQPRRAVVELRRHQGGLAPHVLLGARYEPDGTDLLIRIGEGGRSARRSCRVRLGGRRLIPGLPPDLVEPAMRGIARTVEVAPGSITVDRAGFDPVETSPLIVELAGELLGRLLSVRPGQQLGPDRLRKWLESLP